MICSLSDRNHYNSLKEAIYLNQASLGLVGQPAVSAMHAYLDDIGRHGNLYMSDTEEVAFLTPLRQQAAKLMNCPPEQLAIIGSAGEMLSQIPYLLQPKKGSKILTVSSEFPAVTRPWNAYAAENGLELHFVEEHIDENLTDSIIDVIDEETSVVAVSYVQFSTGTKVDIHRLREATRKVGAKLIVDVTQAAGAIPIDANGWQAEVIVCSGYKWLGGHGGVGLAVMSPYFLNKIPPAPGWMGAENPFDMQATKLPLANDARRYTQSTMSYISIKGLEIAITELLNMSAENIENHSNELARIFTEDLNASQWSPYRAPEDTQASSHIITLCSDIVDMDRTIAEIKKAKIMCGSRNGRIRVSVAHYNDENDIRALANILKV